MNKKDKCFELYKKSFINRTFVELFYEEWDFVATELLPNCNYELEALPEIYIDLIYEWAKKF